MRNAPRSASSRATGADYRQDDTRRHDNHSHLLAQTRARLCTRTGFASCWKGSLASEMVWSRLVKWLLLRLIELYRRDALAAMHNFWANPLDSGPLSMS